jgi:Tol biopolymer transport system component
LPEDQAALGVAVISGDTQLWLSNSQGALGVVAAAPPGGYLQDPVFSPDGKAIAYARFIDLAGEAGDPSSSSMRFASDIWLTDLQGASRPLATRDRAEIQFSQPTWTPDGSGVVYVRGEFFENGGVKGFGRRIERQTLATGERNTVVTNGDWPDISRDGTRMAFVRPGETGQMDLWYRELTTAEEHRLAGNQFASITSPRFTPDGRAIVFAGSPYRPRRGVAETTPLLGVLRTWLVATAEAHELLDGLWIVNVDGSRLRRIGQFSLDAPVIHWSSDADHVLLWDEDGLYRANLYTAERQLLMRPGGYRGFDWLPQG